MNELGNITFGNDIKQIAEAIRELSRTIKEFQQSDSHELLELDKYRQSSTLLEFTLTNGGLIKGKITWSGNQSVGVKTDSGQRFILYKHTIAFIQEQTE